MILLILLVITIIIIIIIAFHSSFATAQITTAVFFSVLSERFS